LYTSFLYDVPNDALALERPDKIDKSAVRKEMIDKQKRVTNIYH
jgi:hypothetical protein